MNIKWNETEIKVENESKDKKEFYCYWNNYFIQVLPDKESMEYYKKKYGQTKKMWDVVCIDPLGSYIVEGGFEGTMSKMIQICFNNIGYPLIAEEGIEIE